MRRKNLKGPPWYDKTLHKNIGLYLCLSIYIISIVFVLGQSICVVFLLNKAEEIFLRFFCKKKNIRVLIKPTFVGNFEKYLQIQTLVLIGYSSPTTLPQIPAFALKSM